MPVTMNSLHFAGMHLFKPLLIKQLKIDNQKFV
jgi:hypothetical protein